MKNLRLNVAWVIRYGKHYLRIKQGEVERFYLMPGNGGLELEVDPASGVATPVNAIQEYRQTVGKSLAMRLRTYRKKFREYADVYWDLLPPTPDDNRWRPDTTIPAQLVTFDDTGMYDLLQFLKKNAWQRLYHRSSSGWIREPLSRDETVRLGLQRFTREIYMRYHDQHEETPVPLGTPCANPTYRARYKYKNFQP